VGRSPAFVTAVKDAGEVAKTIQTCEGFIGRAQHLSAIHKLPREAWQAWREHERRAAKERQVRKSSDSVPEILPEQNKGDTRDKIGQRVGVSGNSIDKVGEMLAEMELHDGDPRSHDVTRLADLGISKMQAAMELNPGSKNLGVGGNTMLPPKLEDLGVTRCWRRWSLSQEPRLLVTRCYQFSPTLAALATSWRVSIGVEHSADFCKMSVLVP
jgi:uncharacterized protein YjiS (DUF1127 family)